MFNSLAIAAPPLVLLILLVWSLHRSTGRSGASLLGGVLWGGLVATGLVTLVGAAWLEQPAWYPYVVTPASEELAKGALFLLLVPLGLIPSASVGLAYGLACGLGFALWENGAYFEQYGGEGPPLWLYAARTTGAALLHASSTAVVGAAVGYGARGRTRRWLPVLAAALTVAVALHGAWNYLCLVLADTSELRRILPGVSIVLLVLLFVLSVRKERHRLRVEILDLWRRSVIPEAVAKAMVARRAGTRLRRLGYPHQLASAVLRLASAELSRAGLPPSHAARSDRKIERERALVQSLLEGRRAASGLPLRGAALVVAAAALTVGIHALGHVSPVPGALARRTTVVVSGLPHRPDPLLSVDGTSAYLLWQRRRTKREQVLTWVGPGAHRTETVGELPAGRDDWFEMITASPGVIVGTREGEDLVLRSFLGTEEQAGARFPAAESRQPPCWPWLASREGRTIVAWDRLRKGAWLDRQTLTTTGVFDIPDPFDGVDGGEVGCFRGLSLTNPQHLYEVARPSGGALVASVTLEGGPARQLELCPGRSGLRVHSLSRDDSQVFVLFGGERGGEYQLSVARLDLHGRLLSTCEDLRAMPAGEPVVVGLDTAGPHAYLVWATGAHVLLARVPLPGEGGRERRWVLDRSPRGAQAVVRVSVVDDRLFVAWEGPSPGGRWSVKLLRTEVGDLP